MIQLSRRQVKIADRVGGMELLMLYPKDLPAPGHLEEYTERPATLREHAKAVDLVADSCKANGLVHVRTFVSRINPPNGFDLPSHVPVPVLGMVIIGRRWVGASGVKTLPKTLWVRPEK